MIGYKHTVQYYETDKMGIVHHSNYVRWMEEARVNYLKEIGWDYDRLEASGVISPVTAVNVKYSVATKFPEVIDISVGLEDYNGVRLTFKYVMKNPEGKTVCRASSEHCFLDVDGKIVRLAKDMPGLHETLVERTEIDKS